MAFEAEKLTIDGLQVINPFYMEDDRGSFTKTYEKDVYAALGIEGYLAETFETMSKKDVIRGMHFQTFEPQGKLVRAVFGEIMDVAVDLRVGSPTFGKWESVILSEANHKMFWIPAGFAHGFVVKSDKALVSYSCIGKYHGEADTGIVWNDADLAIDWGIDMPIVSDKDSKLMTFREFADKFQGLQ